MNFIVPFATPGLQVPPLAKYYNAVASPSGPNYVIGGSMNSKSFRKAYVSDKTNEAIVSVAANQSIILTQITVITDNSLATAPSIMIGIEASAIDTSSQIAFSHPGLPADGYFTRGNGGAIICGAAFAHNLLITISGYTAGTIEVVGSYYLDTLVTS